MPGPFATRGATPINAKQDMKYVPIFIGKFFTGLYTNRNPLNEGAVTDIYSKFYQANRNDSIIDGLNTELSPRMTLIRRYGSSPYNSNTFNPINSFQNFFPFQTGVGESIIVIADTQVDVRNVSNGQNSLLYAKNLGSTTSTSIQVAGSGANDGGGGPAWVSPNNITSSSSFATITTINSSPLLYLPSQNLQSEAFGFAVSGTLVNIQVNFQYYSNIVATSGSPTGRYTVQLLRAGVAFGAPQIISLPFGLNGSSSTPMTTSLSFPIVGLTFTDINNAAFGFEIQAATNFKSTLTGGVRFGQLSVSYQNVVSLPGGKMRSQQQLNTLYMVDGVNAKQWVWFPSWQANFAYTQLQSSPDPDNTILDSNNNIEVSVGYSIAIVSTAASSGTLTVNYTGSAIVTIGDSWTFIGLGNATGLNFITVTVLSTGAGSFTAATNLSDYTTLAETNGLAFKNGTAGATGATMPVFGTTVGGTVLDNTVGWINKGNAVEPMGITGPQAAPTVSLSPYTPINPATGAPYSSWVANTFYWKSVPVILQSGNVWQLTQAGTTASSVPGFGGGVGTVQNDGTAQWTNQGSATRVVSTPYALNRAIRVDTSVTQIDGKGETFTHYLSSLMVVTTPGTTSATPTAAISWNTSTGASNQDGTVVWTVIVTVPQGSSSYSSPIIDRDIATSANSVGDNQIVSLVTQIDDVTSGGSGYLQSISSRWGVSNSSAPTWADATGSVTIEASTNLAWLCGGPISPTNTGAWAYAFSYINSVTGDESTASPLSLPILLSAGDEIAVVGPTTTQPGIDAIGVYRTTQGPTVSTTGGTPFFLNVIPMPSSPTWQYLDPSPDPGNTGSILNVEITASGYVFSGGLATNVNDPPPVGLTNLTAHCGRLWGFVGNILYFSTGPDVTVGNGGAAWDVLNFYEFPGTGHRAISTNFNGSTLFIFTSAGMYSIPGQGTVSNPFGQQQSVAPNISVLSYDAFTQDGSTIYVYTADRNLLSMDVNAGFSDVGEPIADLLNSIDPGEAQLAFYVNNNDRALYISDFQTGWYRLAAVAAPETGFLWAPKAELIGGISGIGSVTTAPGINSLLIGPQVSGPILQRDRSVFSDNGSVYDSWATIGNLVLAHPGTMASIRFIALEAIKVGDCPTIGLLLDEFLGYPTTPAYTNLDQPSNDPPKLNASNTLYSVRYWLQQQGEPFWCKSALIRFNLGQSDTASEIVSYAIFGGNLLE